MSGKKDKVQLGVIGAGRIGKVHAANIALRIPGARLVSVSDIHAPSARALAEELQVPTVYEDYHDMLRDPQVQAVVICSSTDTHALITEEAAKAGKHIFCEKPIDL